MATLYVVSTPIGNLGDLSPRAGEILGSVGRILAEDTRRTRVLTEHVGARVPLVSYHAHNEAERLPAVLAALDGGEDVALVSDAGTPLVSDPGERLVAAVVEAGHRVVPVPGPSAVISALVGSGLPADRFVFLGFPPRRGRDRRAFLERVAASDETVVAFESPNRLVALLDELAGTCGPGRRAAVGRELTKVHEEFVRGTIPEVADYYREHPPRGEATVVIAAADNPPPDPGVMEEEARTLARTLLAEGGRGRDVARELADRLDLSRNAAYRIVLEVERS